MLQVCGFPDGFQHPQAVWHRGAPVCTLNHSAMQSWEGKLKHTAGLGHCSPCTVNPYSGFGHGVAACTLHLVQINYFKPYLLRVVFGYQEGTQQQLPKEDTRLGSVSCPSAQHPPGSPILGCCKVPAPSAHHPHAG